MKLSTTVTIGYFHVPDIYNAELTQSLSLCSQESSGVLANGSQEMMNTLPVGQSFPIGTVCTFTGYYFHVITSEEYLISPVSCEYGSK